MTQDIDLHIGRRLFRRRRLLGLTQGHLGASIGVSHQAIHHYECGSAGLSAHKLWALAVALSVPVEYFYDGLRSAEA